MGNTQYELQNSRTLPDHYSITHHALGVFMFVYYNGKIMPKEDVIISPDDRGFYFGDGVYEVLSVYKERFLAEEMHYTRLRNSLSALRIPEPDINHLKSAVNQVLTRNGLLAGPAMVYMQITRGAARRRHAFPDEALTPTIYITANAYTPPLELWKNGVKVILHPDERWGRCDIKSLNLLPNVLASQAAREEGAYDAILHRDGVVTEGSHTGVCGVMDGTVYTHPLNHRILASVTRGLVIESCGRLGIPLEMVTRLDELMVLGTTTEVMPVVRIGEKVVGDGRPGPVTRRLQKALREMVLTGSR
jgi:D-alanine transaminase